MEESKGLFDLIDGMGEAEKKALADVFRQAKENAESKKFRQIRPIVPAKQWINSSYYAGPDYKKVYPVIRDEFLDICESEEPKYNEVIIEGGIRTGKSVLSDLIIKRKLYEMSCYENVQDKFNLMSTTLITIAYLTVNLQTAEIAGFGAFRESLDIIPYFNEHFSRDKGLNKMLKFPNRILMLAGSTENHFIGTAMLYFIMDEANFFSGGLPSSDDMREYNKTSGLYETAINRGTLQYTNNGINNSLAILVSSPTYASSFVERRKKKAIGNPKVKLIRLTLWKVKPQNYGTERFLVFIGSNTLEPCVVESVQKINDYLVSTAQPPLDESITEVRDAYNLLSQYDKMQFEWVPQEFRERFNTTAMYKAMQDIVGVCVQPQGRLFSSNIHYNKAVDNEGIGRAFLQSKFTISTDSPTSIEEYFNPQFNFPQPEKPRFLHIDQSTSSDRTGIACCYEKGKVLKGGVLVSDIEVDFHIAIVPPEAPAKIDISKTEQFVFWLAREKGVTFGKVTADTWGSTQFLQDFAKADIPSEVLSLDRTDTPYLMYTELYYQERIHHRDDNDDELGNLRVELFGLIHDRSKGKVTHQEEVSGKDRVDGVAGVCYSCLDYYGNPKTVVYNKNDVYQIDGDKVAKRIASQTAEQNGESPMEEQELKKSGVWDMLTDNEKGFVASKPKTSRYDY